MGKERTKTMYIWWETFSEDHMGDKGHFLSFKERSIYSFNSFDLQVLSSVK